MDKIKVAFIYKASNIFMTGKHFDNTYYNFFIKALGRNSEMDLTLVPTEEIFDSSKLKNKFDVILLWENNTYGMPEEIYNIENLDIPVIARAADPGDAKNSVKSHKKWKIDYYFDFLDKSFFYDLYPSNFNHKTIIFGVEPSLYQNVTPIKDRIKDKILNSGAIGNTKFTSRIINTIRNPKWNALQCYKLRTKCSKLPYVDYTSTLNHEFVNDKYPLLLDRKRHV